MLPQLAVVIATVVVTVLLPSCQAEKHSQYATLYGGKNGAGQTLTLVEYYQPKLAHEDFNDAAHSACVVGIWLFYDYTNYNQGTGGLMEWVYGPGQKCVNFNKLGGKVTSVRFAGSPNDYRSSTLTLYAQDYFSGAEEYVYQDEPSIALAKQRSLIVTGNSAYTVYDRSDYSGNSMCIYPEEPSQFKPAFVYDLANIGIPYNSIKSVRKGCVGKKAAHARSMPKGRSTVSLSAAPAYHFSPAQVAALQSDDIPLTNKKF